jgi:signal transduction histidine kinase
VCVCHRGEGDLHLPNYSHMNQMIVLNSPGQFGNYSASYSLTLYPNDELFDVYSTNNPTAATAGVVCIIIFMSLLFFMFDFFVRQEFHQKKAIIEAKRQFVRFVSHEVRTPLNAISMGLQLLRGEIARLVGQQPGDDSDTSTSVSTSASIPMEGSLQDKMRGWLDLSDDILSNTHSAVDVLNDLLNYDKIESGTLQLEVIVVPIWALIDRTTSEFQLQAKKKKINYVLDFSALTDPVDDDCNKSVRASKLSRDVKENKVLGDKMRIAQVLRNLISNALKFTPEGGEICSYQWLLFVAVNLVFSMRCLLLQSRLPCHSGVLAEG